MAEALGPEPGVHVEKYLVQGRPARALAEAAEGAELLVTGSHGRGELPGMHLGSAASYCVHHAPCLVAVVRGRHTGR
jgi:nucleotide-binding universal stress UspA family protein